MPAPVPIVETQGRTAAGVSRPYKCLGADGNLYFVKTSGMGVDAMIRDWLMSSAAAQMGLPVATAALVEISADLSAGQNELTAGIAYGSREVTHAVSCTGEMAEQSDPITAARILLFDWWCRNEDRKFSLLGGNPNLLYLPADRRIVMIDHDNALDDTFGAETFWSGHGLASRKEMFLPGPRCEAEEWLLRGREEVARLWTNLPEEWLQSPEGEPRTGLALDTILEMLERPRTDENFWTVP